MCQKSWSKKQHQREIRWWRRFWSEFACVSACMLDSVNWILFHTHKHTPVDSPNAQTHTWPMGVHQANKRAEPGTLHIWNRLNEWTQVPSMIWKWQEKLRKWEELEHLWQPIRTAPCMLRGRRLRRRWQQLSAPSCWTWRRWQIPAGPSQSSHQWFGITHGPTRTQIICTRSYNYFWIALYIQVYIEFILRLRFSCSHWECASLWCKKQSTTSTNQTSTNRNNHLWFLNSLSV